MFRNALVFRFDHWEPPTLGQVEQRLDAARFVECGASQHESTGWVAPRGDKHAVLAESVGGHVILRLCTETKPVPGSVVKLQLQARLDQIEQQTGRRPKGKAARELKEDVVHGLLPRAFPKRGHTGVWLDAKAGLVWIEATSMKKADAVVTRLVELMGGGLRLSALQTELSPATAMSAWLSEKQAPAGFSIDRDCELKQPDSEKAAVRYTRHSLEIDELAAHIQQGKRPTQLALTWAGRVSFVLTETLALKRIKLLDVVLESAGRGEGAADAGADFDSDVALFTGELGRLLPDLIEALGGVQQPTVPAPATAPAAASGAEAEAAPWESAPI